MAEGGLQLLNPSIHPVQSYYLTCNVTRNLAPRYDPKGERLGYEDKQDGDKWILTYPTDDETEVEKVRTLGYIGLLAEGAHHQLHHWMIATGKMNME